MLIKNGVIHTMDGPVIDRGYVWVEGSRIAGVGGMDALPPEEHFGPVVDVQEGHVLPGFLDIHCHLGMIGTAVGFEGEDVNEETAPCTPQLRGLDGVNPMDEAFAEARRAGVTCVVTGPGQRQCHRRPDGGPQDPGDHRRPDDPARPGGHEIRPGRESQEDPWKGPPDGSYDPDGHCRPHPGAAGQGPGISI